MPNTLHETGQTVRIASFRLDATSSAALEQLAETMEVSQSDVVRMLVLEAVAGGRATWDNEMVDSARACLAALRLSPSAMALADPEPPAS